MSRDLLAVLAFMRLDAKSRTFGLAPGDLREAVRHGFLLGLEQVEGFVREVERIDGDAVVTSPRATT